MSELTPHHRELLHPLLQAEHWLTIAEKPDEFASIMDVAEAARVFAQRAKLGTVAINKATAIKLKAEIRLAAAVNEGQANGTIAKAGGDKKKTIITTGNNGQSFTDLGLHAKQIHDARLIASTLPTDGHVDALIDEQNRKDEEASRSKILREAKWKRKKEEAERRSSEPSPLPAGQYDLILADPPWTYPETTAPLRDGTQNHYPTLEMAEIAAIQIPAAEDAVLLMWATSPLIDKQLPVMAAWGFTYRTCAVWVKHTIGVGSWWRQQHELLLLGVRGNPGAPLPENRPPSVFHEPRTGHSVKPDVFHDMAESMFPHLKARLEMFARRPRDGWTVWGNDDAVAS